MAPDDLLTRLKASADHLARLHDAQKAEAERRNGLIIDLRDLDITWERISRAARLGQSQCKRIVCDAPEDIEIGYQPQAV